MLRSTFMVFVGFVLLLLALTVGYAALRFGGPESTYREARAAMAAGEHADAIRMLDRAEKDLAPRDQPQLRDDILMLRVDAHVAVGNLRLALRDLHQLCEVFRPDDAALHRRRIELLLRAGDAETGLQRAEEFQRRFGSDAYVEELGGQACQQIYQERIRGLLRGLRLALPRGAYARASRLVRRHLYLPAGHPAAEAASRAFQRLLRQHKPQLAVTNSFAPELAEIRGWIGRAQGHYRRTLEIPDARPVRAFTGLAFALRQAERYDDLAMLCEIYLARFDHAYTTIAAAYLTELHFEAGRHLAAIEAARRFLPPGAWRSMLEDGRLNEDVRRLLLALVRAHDCRGQLDELVEVGRETEAMLDAGLDLRPHSDLILALLHARTGRPDLAMPHLEAFTRDPAVRASGNDGEEDLFEYAMGLRVEQLADVEAGLDAQAALFREWQEQRPGSAAPLIERARLWLSRGQHDRALIDTRAAMRLVGHDEQALLLHAEAADGAFQRSGRGAAQLLAQCLELGSVTPPDIADEVLYLPLARRALEAGRLDIAEACAALASEYFNWARTPRYVRAEAALRRGGPQRAADQMRALLEYHPRDRRALLLLREAMIAAGEDSRALSFDLAMVGGADPRIARHLILESLRGGREDLAARFADNAIARFADDPDTRLAVARAWLEVGREDLARALLQDLLTLDRERPDIARDALLLVARLIARDSGPAVVDSLAGTASALLGDRTDHLVELVELLEEHRHDRQALQLIDELLRSPRHADGRTASTFALGGRLALRNGRTALAETWLTAAFAFPDGADEAGLPLALLLLAQGRTAEAADSWWADEITTFHEACLATQLRRPLDVAAWVEGRIAATPGIDVMLLCLRAVLDTQAPLPGDIVELAHADRELLLGVLTFSDVPGFGAHAIELAATLRDRHPENLIARFLWARAHDAAGHERTATNELLAITRTDPAFVPAVDEALRLIEKRGDPLELVPDPSSPLFQATAALYGIATPRMRALFGRVAARTLLELGNTDLGTEVLVRTWIEYPRESRAGLDEVRRLVQLGRRADALALIDALEPIVPKSERSVFLSFMVTQIEAILAADDDPRLRHGLLEQVRGTIAREGPYGSLVHLLIDHGGAIDANPEKLREDPELARIVQDRRQLLVDHLAFFAAGKDRDAEAAAESLRELRRLDGDAAVLERTDRILRNDPSLLPVWIARAEVLEGRGEYAEAMASLRWLYPYVLDDELLITGARIAAQHGDPAEPEAEAIWRLGTERLQRPDAELALGLLALRASRHAEAYDRLGSAAARADGAHLYYRALAGISGRAAPPGQVRALLDRLAAEHAGSVLADNAAHFAAQLGALVD